MLKRAIPAIVLFILLSQVALAFAQSENTSAKEIDRIENTENCKTIYYADESKAVYLTLTENTRMSFAVSSMITEITVPPPFPIEKILELVKFVQDNVSAIASGCSLLAMTVWLTVRRLRQDRPKDYNGVENFKP
jgi:succinyl-CoA synthetase alpha subunit